MKTATTIHHFLLTRFWPNFEVRFLCLRYAWQKFETGNVFGFSVYEGETDKLILNISSFQKNYYQIFSSLSWRTEQILWDWFCVDKNCFAWATNQLLEQIIRGTQTLRLNYHLISQSFQILQKASMGSERKKEENKLDQR